MMLIGSSASFVLMVISIQITVKGKTYLLSVKGAIISIRRRIALSGIVFNRSTLTCAVLPTGRYGDRKYRDKRWIGVAIAAAKYTDQTCNCFAPYKNKQQRC